MNVRGCVEVILVVMFVVLFNLCFYFFTDSKNMDVLFLIQGVEVFLAALSFLLKELWLRMKR